MRSDMVPTRSVTGVPGFDLEKLFCSRPETML